MKAVQCVCEFAIQQAELLRICAASGVLFRETLTKKVIDRLNVQGHILSSWPGGAAYHTMHPAGCKWTAQPKAQRKLRPLMTKPLCSNFDFRLVRGVGSPLDRRVAIRPALNQARSARCPDLMVHGSVPRRGWAGASANRLPRASASPG